MHQTYHLEIRGHSVDEFIVIDYSTCKITSMYTISEALLLVTAVAHFQTENEKRPCLKKSNRLHVGQRRCYQGKQSKGRCCPAGNKLLTLVGQIAVAVLLLT